MSDTRYIGLLDVSGVQDYLYRNNKLKDIAAASRRIESLSRRVAVLARRDAADPLAALFDRVAADIEEVDLVVAAGGNAFLVAERRDALTTFFRRVSRTLLEDGTGLQVVTAIHECPDGRIAPRYRAALAELERRKLTQGRDAICMPPGTTRPPGERENGTPPTAEYSEPRDQSLMICQSESEQSDLMAVVSMDGIGMGQRLNDWLTRMEKEPDDRVFLTGFEIWSTYIKDRWEKAWEKASAAVQACFPAPYRAEHPFMWEKDGEKRAIRLRVADRRDGGVWLPFRKIYQGGDDLTFVCDARVALLLTTHLLRALDDAHDTPPGVAREFHSLATSAGILFVNSHFPFIRAVELSDRIGKAAKKRAAAQKSTGRPQSVLDWWVNRQGALERPDPLWQTVAGEPGSTARPYLLSEWDDLERTVLRGLWDKYRGSRNKFKDLLEAAGEGHGGAAVERLLRLRPLSEGENGDRLEFLEGTPYHAETGFDASGRTPLLDAGELYDIHFPLAQSTKKETAA